jgi:hypothetical protein
MRTLLALLLTLPTFCSITLAADGDDVLRLLLAKSPFVVQGKIENDPAAIRYEAGVNIYVCKFTVTQVLHGDVELKNEIPQVSIIRFEWGFGDRHPLLRRDAECILFLKPTTNSPKWETSDPWLGFQHASPAMAAAVKSLSAEKQKSAAAK